MEVLNLNDKFCEEIEDLAQTGDFGEKVACIYNPLIYADEVYKEYLRRFVVKAGKAKRNVFLGMNPGPWGMAQTGVPFGEVRAVRHWMKINPTIPIGKPKHEHPKKPVLGFACKRSEISGARLWTYFEKLFPNAEDFFAKSVVLNYCPLLFLSKTGANLTPDKLPANTRKKLEKACDAHLAKTLILLKPKTAIGIGVYAEKRAEKIVAQYSLKMQVTRILHPSPASPIANRGWEAQAAKQLAHAGVKF